MVADGLMGTGWEVRETGCSKDRLVNHRPSREARKVSFTLFLDLLTAFRLLILWDLKSVRWHRGCEVRVVEGKGGTERTL